MPTGFLRARTSNQLFGEAPPPAPVLSPIQQDAVRLDNARSGRKPVLLGGGGPIRSRPVLTGAR